MDLSIRLPAPELWNDSCVITVCDLKPKGYQIKLSAK